MISWICPFYKEPGSKCQTDRHDFSFHVTRRFHVIFPYFYIKKRTRLFSRRWSNRLEMINIFKVCKASWREESNPRDDLEFWCECNKNVKSFVIQTWHHEQHGLDTRVAIKTFRTVSGCLTRALARGNVMDTCYADVYIVIIIYIYLVLT